MGSSPERVAIVGGGVAGLSARAELSRLGIPSRVFEADPRVGGKTRIEPVGGLRVEAAAPRILEGFSTLRSVLAAEDWSDDPSLRFGELWEPHATGYRLARAGPLDVSRPRFGNRGARRMARLVRRFRGSEASRFDDRSLAAHTTLYFGKTDGAERARRLGDWLGLPPEDTSRAAAIGLEEPASTLASCRVPLCARVDPAIYRGNSRVVEIAKEPTGLRLEFEAGGSECFAAALVATPAAAASQIVRNIAGREEREILESVVYRPAAVLHLELKGPFFGGCMELLSPGPRAPALARVSAESTGGLRVPTGLEHVALVASQAFAERADQSAESVVEGSLLDGAEALFPGISARCRVAKLIRFDPGVPGFPVGHFARVRTLLELSDQERKSGRPLAYAGEYLRQPTLEGAAASGLSAARALADLLAAS